MSDTTFVILPIISVKSVPNPAYNKHAASEHAAVGKSFDVDPEIIQVEKFDIRVRVDGITGYNPVTQVPAGSDILSTIYMAKDSGLPQLFTSLTVEELEDAIDLAWDE